MVGAKGYTLGRIIKLFFYLKAVFTIPFISAGGVSTGAVFVFGLQSGQWVQTALVFAADSAFHASFGISVAAGTNTIVVGANRADGKLCNAIYLCCFEFFGFLQAL